MAFPRDAAQQVTCQVLRSRRQLDELRLRQPREPVNTKAQRSTLAAQLLGIDGSAHAWVLEPATNILYEMTLSMQKYLNIKPGSNFKDTSHWDHLLAVRNK
jgi:hypothetical protein